MITTIITAIRERLAQRRHYARLIAEIETLNTRDLQDLRADPIEMRRQAWISVYGQAGA